MATQTSVRDQAIMQTASAAARKYPQDAARIARAGQLLLAGAVRQVTPLLWLVHSQSTNGVTYSVVEGQCDCPDFTSRRRDDYSCKHGLAVWMHGIAQQRAAVLAAREWSPEDQKRLEFALYLVEHGVIGEGE